MALGRTSWNFRNKLTVLLILLNTVLKCLTKLNFDSNIVPKGHSISYGASLDMTHLRILYGFGKLLQYLLYDNPENFNLTSCTD